jgi:hypothetical protein
MAMRINNPQNLPNPGPAWRHAKWNGVTVHTYTQSWFMARRLAAEALEVEECIACELLEPGSPKGLPDQFATHRVRQKRPI